MWVSLRGVLEGLSQDQLQAIPGLENKDVPAYLGPHYPKISKNNADYKNRLKSDKIS